VPPPPRNPTAGRSLRSVPPVPVAREPERRAPVARPAPAASPSAPLALVLWPAVVTLAVTLLRLVGERRGWNPDYFSTLPGGGLAFVGITWLVPFVGAYFGWEFARARKETPGLAGLVGWNLAALAVGLGIGYGLTKALNPSPTRTIVLWAVVSLVVSAMSLTTWPALGKLLLAYAVAARVPVLLVMALAIRGRWGTHYDALQPGFPLLSGPGRWLWTGLLPQATVWVAFTLAVGAAFSAVGVLVASRRAR
jgi:hypothetical protein